MSIPTPVAAARPSSSAEEERAVPLRHPGRWVAAVAVLLVLAAVIRSMVTNDRFQWDVVGEYLFSPDILHGLWRTLWLTAVSMTGAIVLGVIVALMRLSVNPVLSTAAAAYTWFFRGTPLLVQLIFLFNISALYPEMSISIPFGPELFSINANKLLTPTLVAVVGLSVNESAYMSEIVRAGIASVDPGQTEAAQALGMPRSKVLRRIVLPQAMRVIIPPTGNETISMLKYTSLVSVIALPELLYSAQIIYSRSFETIPLLMVACIWYLVFTSVLSVGQAFLERKFSPQRHRAESRWARIVRYLRPHPPVKVTNDE